MHLKSLLGFTSHDLDLQREIFYIYLVSLLVIAIRAPLCG